MEWTVQEVREKIKEKYSEEIAKNFEGKFSELFCYFWEKKVGLEQASWSAITGQLSLFTFSIPGATSTI